jgi:hypothetical protein
MRYRLPLIALGAALLAACGPTADPSASDSAVPPAPASASASAAPSDSGISVHIQGAEPAFPNTLVDEEFVLPAALTFADGAYHLWGKAFDAENEIFPRTFYATSPDLVDWEVADTDPLAEIGLVLESPGPVPASVLEEADGTWVMFLWGYPSEGVPVFYRATAAEPEGPWTADPEPVLTRTSGSWDGGGLDFPTVVHTGGGYLMLYSAWRLSEPGSDVVGVATSSDGTTWTKGAEPVIRPGLCGAFDARSITLPRLRSAGPTGWYLFYNGLGEDLSGAASVGVASSPDLQTWTCANPVPALVAADIPDSEGIHTIAVAADAQGPEFLVESLGDGFSNLWMGDVSMPAP